MFVLHFHNSIVNQKSLFLIPKTLVSNQIISNCFNTDRVLFEITGNLVTQLLIRGSDQIATNSNGILSGFVGCWSKPVQCDRNQAHVSGFFDVGILDFFSFQMCSNTSPVFQVRLIGFIFNRIIQNMERLKNGLQINHSHCPRLTSALLCYELKQLDWFEGNDFWENKSFLLSSFIEKYRSYDCD